MSLSSVDYAEIASTNEEFARTLYCILQEFPNELYWPVHDAICSNESGIGDEIKLLHDAGNPNVVDTAVSLIQSKTSVLEDFGGSLDVAIGWFHGKTRWDKE
jgi:hypothetical protein